MAFTEAQRVSARKYCGRPIQPQRDRFGGSELGDVDVAMDALVGDAAREAAIVEQLGKCDAVEAEIASMHGFVPLSQAEEVKVDPEASAKLRVNLARECSTLASMLGVKIKNNVATGGWRGGYLRIG